MSDIQLNTIEEVLDDIRLGKMVVVVDDEDRENEGDLIIAAQHATPEAINFMTQHARGLVCLSMTNNDFERLQIPMMAKRNRSTFNTAFGVSIEAAQGVTTGISACDRSHTIQIAASPNSTPDDIVMPGHIFPLRANESGVLERNGHTEAGVDLARLAGLHPAAVICEIMNADGSMARMPQLLKFVKQHNLKLISIQDLITYRITQEVFVSEEANARLPIRGHGDFTVKTFKASFNNIQHLAVIHQPMNVDQPVLVRLHSECLTGDALGSARCDCGQQLDVSLAQIAKHGGVLLYLRQEGRGIGLGNKIKAYELQDKGMDTVEANQHLGFGADQRDYGVAAQILKSLGVSQVRLLTNSPRKINQMQRYDVDVVEQVPLEIPPTSDNIKYLQAKKDKLGHLLSL